MTWDERFMRLAHEIADWSKDPSRGVGAVVVGPDNEIRSTGYNGLPRGVCDHGERYTPAGDKYTWISHAERNAIYNAARMGTSLEGCTMYIPWFPCADCTKGIIQSGITTVVCYKTDPEGSQWDKLYEISETMLRESGVVIRYIEPVAQLQPGKKAQS